jgi:mono/diheme cytochrome c family protein
MKEIFKEQLSQLKENPGRAFGLVYPFMLIIGLTIGIYYLSHLDSVARQSIPPKLQDTATTTDLPLIEAKSIPPIDVISINNPTDELVQKGKQLYSANCASCHGEDGTGNGPAAAGLNPAPRDFTDSTNWKNGMKLVNIYQTLEEGINGSGMIAYDFIIPEEKFAIAHYIRTQFIPNPPQNSNDDLAALDLTYNLSQGKEVPAQIPVAAAINLIVSENQSTVQKAEQIVNAIDNDKSSEGAGIFNRVTKNPLQAVALLSSYSGWKDKESEFIKALTSNVRVNGFNREVFLLSEDDWTVLHNYLRKFF